MKLSDMILKATEHDTASSSAEQILRIAKQNNTIRQSHHPHLRTAVVIAAVLCLLTATLYASGILSGFAAGFSVPLESGEVQVLKYDSDNTAVDWTITEVWYDSYNLHIGGTVKTPDILDPEQVYKAMASFRSADDGETYYLDGTLYPNGTDTVPFVMSAPTVTDGADGAFRPGWTDETVKIDLTIELIHKEPENMTGQWDNRDYAVYPGTWNITLACLQQEHCDTVTLSGPFIGTTEEAVTAEQVKLSPFTLEINGKNLMRDSSTRYNIWLKMEDGTYILKGRGMFRDESGNWIAYDDCTSDRIAVSFYAPIDVSEAEAIIFADAHGFGGAGLADHAEASFACYSIEDPAALNVITDIDGTVTELWKVLLEIPLK